MTDPQPTRESRWTTEQLDELKTELARRHLLDPLWRQCADAIGSLQFDLVDAQHSTAAPVSGDALADFARDLESRQEPLGAEFDAVFGFGPDLYVRSDAPTPALNERIEAALTAAEDKARRAEYEAQRWRDVAEKKYSIDDLARNRDEARREAIDKYEDAIDEFFADLRPPDDEVIYASTIKEWVREYFHALAPHVTEKAND